MCVKEALQVFLTCHTGTLSAICVIVCEVLASEIHVCLSSTGGRHEPQWIQAQIHVTSIHTP